MKKWLFNPFIYVAGMRSLLIGFSGMAIASIIAFFSKAHFDGAIDIHVGAPLTVQMAFIEPLLDWVCLVLPLYVFGRIASESSIRFIDVAGTLALARWPMIFAAFLGFLPVPKFDMKNADLHYLMAFTTNPSVIVLMLLTIQIMVWTIILMFNAFAVSTNLKGGKAATAFIAGLIIAEVISKVILKFLL
jgi:hypothetical protein